MSWGITASVMRSFKWEGEKWLSFPEWTARTVVRDSLTHKFTCFNIREVLGDPHMSTDIIEVPQGEGACSEGGVVQSHLCTEELHVWWCTVSQKVFAQGVELKEWCKNVTVVHYFTGAQANYTHVPMNMFSLQIHPDQLPHLLSALSGRRRKHAPVPSSWSWRWQGLYEILWAYWLASIK